MALKFATILGLIACIRANPELFGVSRDLHFSLESRAENIDGTVPIYKSAKASVEDRVNDLLPRMSVAEKVSQM